MISLSRNSQPPTWRAKPIRYAGCLALVAGLTACSSTVADPPATSSSPVTTASDTATTPSGTASSGTTTASGTTTPDPGSGTTTPSGRTIAIAVTGSTVTPKPAQIDLAVGETVTLVVTSDHDDQLHAHGFEIEEDVRAGQPTTLTLTGKDSGVFEVEMHHPALTILTVAVR